MPEASIETRRPFRKQTHSKLSCGTKTETRGVRRTQRGGFNAELETWLTQHESLLGERSTFGGLVASIERGVTSGNSGTKGCGISRIEPFEGWISLRNVHAQIGRAGKCELAFRMLTRVERWLLCSRYLYVKTALPPGMYGALGDLSVVAMVVADQLDLLPELFQDAAKQRFRDWEPMAARMLEKAHRSYTEAKAEVEREEAAEALQESGATQ